MQLLRKKGHLERVCNQKTRDTNKNYGKPRGLGNRVQLVDQDEIGEGDDEYMVLKAE